MVVRNSSNIWSTLLDELIRREGAPLTLAEAKLLFNKKTFVSGEIERLISMGCLYKEKEEYKYKLHISETGKDLAKRLKKKAKIKKSSAFYEKVLSHKGKLIIKMLTMHPAIARQMRLLEESKQTAKVKELYEKYAGINKDGTCRYSEDPEERI